MCTVVSCVHCKLLRVSRESMIHTHNCFFGLCTLSRKMRTFGFNSYAQDCFLGLSTCPATSMTLLLWFRVCTEACPEEGACGEVAHVLLRCLLCLRLFVVVCCLLNHGIRWMFLLPASLRTRGNSLFLHTLTYGWGVMLRLLPGIAWQLQFCGWFLPRLRDDRPLFLSLVGSNLENRPTKFKMLSNSSGSPWNSKPCAKPTN